MNDLFAAAYILGGMFALVWLSVYTAKQGGSEEHILLSIENI